jgi:hypothetical protein
MVGQVDGIRAQSHFTLAAVEQVRHPNASDEADLMSDFEPDGVAWVHVGPTPAGAMAGERAAPRMTQAGRNPAQFKGLWDW